MEKNSRKNLKKDATDITKIYEIIRDKGFTHDLWLDVLSDLREKPSYVKLKSMVEQVIETSVKNYATKPKDHEEKLKTRTTFTDLGIMTYTIDTLISDVLKKKLKDELISMISRVINDHDQTTNLETTDNKTDAVFMLEDIGKLLCCNGTDVESHSSNDTPGPSKVRLSGKIVSSPSSAKKRNRNSIEKETSLVKHGSLHMSCSNIINSDLISPSKMLKNSNKSDVISNNENSDVDVTNVSDDEEDNYSIRSISSVHTSDLSSFEDDISISSEDETGAKVKKRVSLKLANELYSSGRLSDIHNVHQRTEKQVSLRSSEEHPVDSSSQRSSTRARKPNSKYASEDVICPMKLLFTDSCISDKETEETFIPTNGSEMQQSSSPNISVKRERNPSKKELKNDMGRRNSAQDSESSDLSDSSLRSLSNMNGKQTVVRRGRPKKDKLLTEQTSPVFEQRSETKAKRRRPSKGSHEELVAKKKLCVLDEMLPNLEKKLQLQTGATRQNSENVSQSNDKNTEIKRKRGRPSNNNSVKELDDKPIQHSVESFSKFEERLCQDNKVNVPSSPSKSTKSYDTSDLYKPRSDFRIFNSSRESRAFTLFSN